MIVSDVVKAYQDFCPPSLALEGDSCGLQFGSMTQEVKRVMVTLDIKEETVAEAIAKEVDMIITKHAPIFRPMSNLRMDNPANHVYISLIRHNIAVYVSHTDIDVLPGGLNDWFCESLHIQEIQPLHITKGSEGIGRVGNLPTPMTAKAFALQVKASFGLDSLSLIAYPGQEERLIRRIAICGGSGSSFYKDAVAQKADLYITGDITYHIAQDMLTHGLIALDPGHYIEWLFVPKVSDILSDLAVKKGWDIAVNASETPTDPIQTL